MASRSNFRVKVDLSKYHRDARRMSWIFVDSASCCLISHIKQHIVNIFHIQEPFHLLLNSNEYLPPTEDVRILKENEIIVVAPGLGLNDANAVPPSMHTPLARNGFMKSEASKLAGDVITHGQNDCQTDTSLAGTIQQNISTAEETVSQSLSEVTEMESASESKENGDNYTENGRNSDICELQIQKRKRTRRKRTTKKTKMISADVINDRSQINNYQPTISGSSVLPAGTHIRFDNVDTNQGEEMENWPNNQSTRNSSVTKNSGIANLSALLALRNSSCPLTFASKKVPSQNDNAFTDKEPLIESIDLPIDRQEVNNKRSDKSFEEESNYSQLNPEEYPTLQSPTKPNDIIAFKILKIGQDYSPEISDYVIAKTRLWWPKTLLYTFEILQGRDQIQTPIGKFTLPGNEEEDIDTANFNFSQLIDPRLIHRQQIETMN